VPAAFNNIVGLKPTRGLISTAGVVPACRTLDCVSVFALSCVDARAVFEAARGVDARDSFSRAMPPVGPQRAPAAPVRFALPSARDLEFFGDAHAADAFAVARRLLTEIGSTATEIDFTPFRETAALLYEGPWVAERLAAIKPFFTSHPDSLHDVTRRVIAQGQNYSALDVFEAIYRLQDLKRECDAVWRHADVLVVPTTGTIYRSDEIAADPVRLNTHLGYYTNFVNLLDLCAIAVPTGFRADGLPAGVTLIAPAFADTLLCGLGHELHAAARLPMGATKFPLSVTASAPS
jgi:allophanate hydrolase